MSLDYLARRWQYGHVLGRALSGELPEWLATVLRRPPARAFDHMCRSIARASPLVSFDVDTRMVHLSCPVGDTAVELDLFDDSVALGGLVLEHPDCYYVASKRALVCSSDDTTVVVSPGIRSYNSPNA